MAGFSMFHLKDPSLLAYRESMPYRTENLKQIYELEEIPSDSGLRNCLDGVAPDLLKSVYKDLIEFASEEGMLTAKRVLGGQYLAVPFDATGYFSSTTTNCKHCLVKNHQNGETIYHHQAIGAVIAQPGAKNVFPIWAEAIQRQDGAVKNDCERNAAKRLIPTVREMLGDERIIALMDALYTDGPNILALQQAQMNFIITIKDGYPLIQAEKQALDGTLSSHTWTKDGKMCILQWANDLVLNGQYQHIRVNYLHYQEIKEDTGEIVYRNEWITDLDIIPEQLPELVMIARARWQIENETFNTLKNQGYHLEHNYGHGKQYLSTIFALLMLLAFFVDQVANHVDQNYKKARAMFKTNRAFFNRIAQVFDLLPCMSMNSIYRFMCGEIKVSFPKIE